jgi:ABC-type nitrate/sulfonate/bicarbonate transport system ATPase subunit
MHGTLPSAADRCTEPPSPEPLLVVHDVSKSYPIQNHRLGVLQGINLALPSRRFAAIVGPSGAGKSTLLNLIAGLEEPDSGTILLGGSARRLGRVGFMPQRDLLHPWRTALDNAIVALEIQGTRRGVARRRARELFQRFGLAGFEDARPAQLSGGMRQRVALVRTLLAGGGLLLLDEPFGALDALTRAQLQDWLLETWPALDRAGVLVTHDVEEALLLADEVYVLSPRPGRIVLRTDVPFERPRGRRVIADARFVRLKVELLQALGLSADGQGHGPGEHQGLAE